MEFVRVNGAAGNDSSIEVEVEPTFRAEPGLAESNNDHAVIIRCSNNTILLSANLGGLI